MDQPRGDTPDRSGVVTLLTDFGTVDGFAAAVKGAVLRELPTARVVDVAHDVPPGDVEAAAFTLLTAVPWFPPGTVHLAVVDPGVGSDRAMMVVDLGPDVGLLVGPDNGVFSYLLDGVRMTMCRRIDPAHFPRACATFQGRDVFGPVAGKLAAGALPADFGPRLPDPIRLAPCREKPGARTGRVLQVDRFGNLVTSVPAFPGEATVRVGDLRVSRRVRCFADLPPGEPGWYAGSLGLIEVGVARDSVAARYGIGRGAPVDVS